MLNEPPEVVEGVGNPGSMQPSSYHGVVHEPSVVAEIDQKAGGYPDNVDDPAEVVEAAGHQGRYPGVVHEHHLRV